MIHNMEPSAVIFHMRCLHVRKVAQAAELEFWLVCFEIRDPRAQTCTSSSAGDLSSGWQVYKLRCLELRLVCPSSVESALRQGQVCLYTGALCSGWQVFLTVVVSRAPSARWIDGGALSCTARASCEVSAAMVGQLLSSRRLG